MASWGKNVYKGQEAQQQQVVQQQAAVAKQQQATRHAVSQDQTSR
jgi:hypothetical protein